MAPNRQDPIQYFHDRACQEGAECGGKSLFATVAKMMTPAGLAAIQHIHDYTAGAGASCDAYQTRRLFSTEKGPMTMNAAAEATRKVITNMTQQRMKLNGETYDVAFLAVTQENPQLAKEYFESTGHVEFAAQFSDKAPRIVPTGRTSATVTMTAVKMRDDRFATMKRLTEDRMKDTGEDYVTAMKTVQKENRQLVDEYVKFDAEARGKRGQHIPKQYLPYQDQPSTIRDKQLGVHGPVAQAGIDLANANHEFTRLAHECSEKYNLPFAEAFNIIGSACPQLAKDANEHKHINKQGSLDEMMQIYPQIRQALTFYRARNPKKAA
jgi:hypothetical protein